MNAACATIIDASPVLIVLSYELLHLVIAG